MEKSIISSGIKTHLFDQYLSGNEIFEPKKENVKNAYTFTIIYKLLFFGSKPRIFYSGCTGGPLRTAR